MKNHANELIPEPHQAESLELTDADWAAIHGLDLRDCEPMEMNEKELADVAADVAEFVASQQTDAAKQDWAKWLAAMDAETGVSQFRDFARGFGPGSSSGTAWNTPPLSPRRKV